MTIRGLFREFVVALQREGDDHDRAVALAWHIAALERQEKLPDLKALLSRRQRSKPQTLHQQRATLHVLSAQMGIPLRPTKLRRRRRG